MTLRTRNEGTGHNAGAPSPPPSPPASPEPGAGAAAAALAREPLVLGGHGPGWVTEKICGVVEAKTPRWWWGAFATAAAVAVFGFVCVAYLISTGVGVWGLNHPVGWAWDIANFVFWIGIGHAGTLISAILLLTRQRWRTSINRAAEAMTLFAVICAGIFPAIHMGRIWMVWFLAPIPNPNAIWPNFFSPLLWDVFAVATYFTVSLVFWYMGLIPDLASLRDRAQTRVRRVCYGALALGWRGSQRQWRHYEAAYLMLAGLSTPLVLSVHTVVSFDFAVSILPGWHATIFPPYFVAGAIFGGLAMVLTLLLPARTLFGLGALVTARHIDAMCKLILLTGSLVAYAYLTEFMTAWYSGDPGEASIFFGRGTGRPVGPYAWAFWTMLACNVAAPQLFWWRRCRRSIPVVFGVCLCVDVGMWFERFVIIVTSLSQDFLPSSWDIYRPTWVEVGTLTGSLGLFVALFLLFIRFLPMIAVAEVKGVLAPSHPAPGEGGNR